MTTRPSSTGALPARVVLVLGALGLIGSGAFLLGDPDDLIGAWLQIGIGIGLAGASLRADSLTGGLVAGLTTAVGLLIGHIAIVATDGDSTIGAGIVVALAVLVVLDGVALIARVRPSFGREVAA